MKAEICNGVLTLPVRTIFVFRYVTYEDIMNPHSEVQQISVEKDSEKELIDSLMSNDKFLISVAAGMIQKSEFNIYKLDIANFEGLYIKNVDASEVINSMIAQNILCGVSVQAFEKLVRREVVKLSEDFLQMIKESEEYKKAESLYKEMLVKNSERISKEQKLQKKEVRKSQYEMFKVLKAKYEAGEFSEFEEENN